MFAMSSSPKNRQQECLSRYFKKTADALRDAYMEEIYANVTIKQATQHHPFKPTRHPDGKYRRNLAGH